MLENIIIGQFYPGNSLIHRLDPRIKIVSALIYMVALFAVNNWLGFSLVVLSGVIITFVSRIPGRYILKGLRPVFLLVVITLILNLLFTPGITLFALGPFNVSREGLSFGMIASFRLILLVVVASLLTLTTTPVNITEGVERLLAPGKGIGIPAHELAMMMTIALRFIPTLIEETEKILKAQQCRGADFGSGSLVARAKTLVPLLVPLFVSSFRRADELAIAMEARGYRGGEGRTRLRELVLDGMDYRALAVSLIFLVVCIASRWWL